MISEIKSYRHSLIKILIPVWLAVAAGVFFVYISSNRQFGLVSGIVFILVGLYPFARAWMRRDFDAFEMINMFLCYFLLLIGIRGLLWSEDGSLFLFYDPHSDHFDILRFKVFSYSTIALLSLYLGYYSRLGNRWLNVLPELNFDWQKRKVLICLIIYFVVSEAALVLFTIKFGGWEGMSSFGENPAALQGQAMQGGSGHILAFLYFFWVIFYVSCIYRLSKKGIVWTNIIFLFCLIQIIIEFLHYGSKSFIVQAIMAYIITRHYLKKMVSLRICAVIIAGIFILFPSLAYIRDHGIYGDWNALKDSYISAFNNPMNFLSPILSRHCGFDPFALFIDSIEYSGKGLELGSTMFFTFYFWIPRAWWPDKPLSLSLTYPEKYGNIDPAGTMAPSLPGELYVNFHLVGIILGFLLLGILMKLCYQYLIKLNHNNAGLLIYLPIVIHAPNILESGTMVMSRISMAVFPVILFLWLVKSKGRRM